MPFVDGGVVLQAGIGAGPGGVSNFVPKFAGGEGFCHFVVGAAQEVPWFVFGDRFQKFIGDAYGVIGVLSGDSEIGFRIPIEIVFGEFEVGEALASEFYDALDVVVRH